MTRRSMVGGAVLIASGMGFPLTQLALQRFGRRGALLVDGVCAGLLLRDVGLIANGAPRRLRRTPAVLLWLETIAAAVAMLVGVPPILDERRRRRALDPRPTTPLEIVRRVSVGALFGFHTWRFRIYLRPDQGRRAA